MTAHSNIQPKLSIVVPIGPREGDLSAIESWLSTALICGIEIVLVHDVSDALTSISFHQLVKEAKYSGVKWISGSYGAPGLARNAGLEITSGQWVGFWDSDDYPDVTNFLAMVYEADELKKTVALGAFRVSNVRLSEANSTINQYDPLQSFDFQIAMNPGLWRFAFRKSLVKEFKFTDLKMGEDQFFLLSVIGSSSFVHISNQIVYDYRIGNGLQLTQQHNLGGQINDFIRELSGHEKVNVRKNLLRFMLIKQSYSLMKRCKKNQIPALVISTISSAGLRCLISFTFSLTLWKYAKHKQVSTHGTRIALAGGLGNQLFQLASGLFVANNEKLELEPRYEKYRRNLDGTYQISKFEIPSNVNVLDNPEPNFIYQKIFNFLLKISTLKNSKTLGILRKAILTTALLARKPRIFINGGLGFDKEILLSQRNSYLIGYFQSFRIASNPSIKTQLMSIKPITISDVFTQLKSEALAKRILIIHIRLGDYKNENKIGLLSDNYYRRALDVLKISAFEEVWVFSDEPDEASTRILRLLENPVVVRSNFEITTEESFQLMRYGSGFVIANSSFSWWAAFLRMNQNAPVVAPAPWFRLQESPEEIYPPDWALVSSD